MNFKSYTCLWPSQGPCDPSLPCVCVKFAVFLQRAVNLILTWGYITWKHFDPFEPYFLADFGQGNSSQSWMILLPRGYLVMPADIETFLVFTMQERCSWYPLGRGRDAVKYPAAPETVPSLRTMSCSSWDVLSVEAEEPWSWANWASLCIKNLLDLSIVDLQCCLNFCCMKKWFSYMYT